MIWSDEKTFSTDGYSPQWVHRLPGGRHEPSNLARSRHSTRRTINVWGCVTFHGPGVLFRINGRLNMHSYMEILTGQLVPFARATFPLPDHEDWINVNFLKTSNNIAFSCMMGKIVIMFLLADVRKIIMIPHFL